MAAFSAAPANVTNTAPAGDQYLNKKSSSTPALTWPQITGSPTTAFTGYAAQQGGTFYGYQQGPGYWGKTFFLWPPDPAAANDWRKKFFEIPNGTTPATTTWHAVEQLRGAWNSPSGNYIINYKAILNWIVNTGPEPVPAAAAGRQHPVLLVDSRPTCRRRRTPGRTRTRRSPILDQRFWKEYIDFVLGVWQDPFGNMQTPGNSDLQLRTRLHRRQQHQRCKCVDHRAGYGRSRAGLGSAPPITRKRPRHRFWFGPATMIQYMLDTGLMPGTAQDVSMIAAKLGIQGAFQDIQNNHPNDLVSLIMFSRPQYSGEPTCVGQFTQPQVTLTEQLQQPDQCLVVSA